MVMFGRFVEYSHYYDVTSLRLCIYYCSSLPCAEAEAKQIKSDRHVSSSIYLPTFLLLSIFFLDEWLFVLSASTCVRFMVRNKGTMEKYPQS